jgi:hypothetical protein
MDIILNYNQPVASVLGCNMNPISYLQLKSSISHDSLISKSNEDDPNIFSIIPINTPPFSNINYTSQIETIFSHTNRSLNSIDIQLLDNYNQEVDLNGIPFSILIKCNIVVNGEPEVDPRYKTNVERIIENKLQFAPLGSESSIKIISKEETDRKIELNIIKDMIYKLSISNKKLNRRHRYNRR